MGHCLWEVSGKVWMSPLVQTNIRLSFDSGSPRHWLFVFSCRQNKLEEALLFSGQFTDALQALTDWLYRVEPQLAEDQPVHGDIDLVLSLIDNHKVKKKKRVREKWCHPNVVWVFIEKHSLFLSSLILSHHKRRKRTQTTEGLDWHLNTKDQHCWSFNGNPRSFDVLCPTKMSRRRLS